MFESVDARTDAQTHGCWPVSHPISSPGAFGPGELKIISNYAFLCYEA